MNFRRLLPSSRRLVLGSLFAVFWVIPLHAQQFNEVALKARYLVGFTNFVEWEDDDRSPPVTIGIMGDEALYTAISNLTASHRKAGRNLEAVWLAPGDSLASLDLLFIADDDQLSLPQVIAEAARYRVLTVGESDGFNDAGGMIEFVLRKNRLRFEINLLATESNRMSLSSKLLRLAESTKR